MPHSTSTPPNPATPESKMNQHLTSSILTLQRTIYDIKQDIRNGIAPSILLPQDLASGMLLLTLDPSPSDIECHITPLSTRLSVLEQRFRESSRWEEPPIPPKAPEYSIIDVADLSCAIALLENSVPAPSSPRLVLGKCEWMWDPAWKEFYARMPGWEECVYLSRWRLNEARGLWEHVGLGGRDMGPERAAEELGSWEDWRWDRMWREWCLDVSSHEDGEKCCVYASRWEERGGEWVYVGGIGNLA
jgi:hypothetical protein